ncbi:hypothetical protein GF371_00705 [Candidatus Woesearchaeota archaeon]|nr:hypothetical protein [Candidatus Woesearchaeota archaeon]
MVREAKNAGRLDESDISIIARRGDLLDLNVVDSILKRAEEKNVAFEPRTKRKLTETEFKEILQKYYPDPVLNSYFHPMYECGIFRHVTETIFKHGRRNHAQALFYLEILRKRIITRQITYLETEMPSSRAYHKLKEWDPALLKKFEDAGAVIFRPAGKRRKRPLYKVDMEIRNALLFDVYGKEERTVKDALEEIVTNIDDEQDMKLQAFAELPMPDGRTFYDHVSKLNPNTRFYEMKLYEIVAHLAVDLYLKRGMAKYRLEEQEKRKKN